MNIIQSLKKVSHAADSTNFYKQLQMPVVQEFENGIVVAATDTHRLQVISDCPLESLGEMKTEFRIPKTAIEAMSVTMPSFIENGILYINGERYINSIYGRNFPDWRKLVARTMQKENSGKVSFCAENLKKAAEFFRTHPENSFIAHPNDRKVTRDCTKPVVNPEGVHILVEDSAYGHFERKVLNLSLNPFLSGNLPEGFFLDLQYIRQALRSLGKAEWDVREGFFLHKKENSLYLLAGVTKPTQFDQVDRIDVGLKV